MIYSQHSDRLKWPKSEKTKVALMFRNQFSGMFSTRVSPKHKKSGSIRKSVFLEKRNFRSKFGSKRSLKRSAKNKFFGLTWPKLEIFFIGQFFIDIPQSSENLLRRKFNSESIV